MNKTPRNVSVQSNGIQREASLMQSSSSDSCSCLSWPGISVRGQGPCGDLLMADHNWPRQTES